MKKMRVKAINIYSKFGEMFEEDAKSVKYDMFIFWLEQVINGDLTMEKHCNYDGKNFSAEYTFTEKNGYKKTVVLVEGY